MPQEFQVLQCYECETFQVHQVKKTTKWQCKMCGEKQSLKKVYARGSGSDCRCHVQKLNTMRGELKASVTSAQYDDRHGIAARRQDDHDGWVSHSQIKAQQLEDNKWSMFVDRNAEGESDDDGETLTDSMFTTDATLFKRGKKRKRINTRTMNGDCKEKQRPDNGAAKYWQDGQRASGSQRFNLENEQWGVSMSEDCSTENQPYNNKELDTRSVEPKEYRDTCVVKTNTIDDCSTSTKLPSKWKSFIFVEEHSTQSQCDSDDISHQSYHSKVDKNVLSNKYNSNTEDLFDNENNADTWLLGNHKQENMKSLNVSDAKKGVPSVGDDDSKTSTNSNLFRNKSVESHVKNVELKQSKWSSYLNCETKTEVTSPYESATKNLNLVNKSVGLTFTVGDLSDEDFDL